MTTAPRLPTDISNLVASYPETARSKFTEIRELVFGIAAENPKIGVLTETLKWGEPAYLTQVSKSGSTLRVAWKPARPKKIGLFVNCQTTLVSEIEEIYPDAFDVEGTRGLYLRLEEPLPIQAVEHCVLLAQTYHLRKRACA